MSLLMRKTDLRHLLGLLSVSLLLVLFLGGCKGRQMQFEQRLAPEIQAMVYDWKTDPLGCEGKRTDGMASSIAQEIMGKKEVREADVEAVLGKREFQHKRNDMLVMGYYYDAECANGTIPEDAVYCVLEFIFNAEGILEDAGPVCG